jgi:hypothetical protein
MLTLYTIPKPFGGHFGVIQRNAIRSWTLLRPRCEVILFGDETGTAEVAAEFGVRHVPTIARNAHGTPLVSDVFAQAERLARHDLVCYINTDIIVMNDLLEAVSRVRRPRFLMLGQRWDLDITAPWDFDDPHWETKLRLEARTRGSLHSYVAADYHVFPKGQWGALPPFAVGRTVYDTWLIWRARSLRVPVIDATRVVLSIHQNHDRTYTSVGMTSPDGNDEFQKGLEFQENLRLAGGWPHVFTPHNSNWILTRRWLLPAVTPWRLWRRFKSTVRLMLSGIRRSLVRQSD